MNRLTQERSPYLLAHANNPVDWYAWGEEALQKAKADNKPILLSIGYSACHWCHVMAHESFENKETANLMNEWFINIKVDREERPDLDKVYQLAHQLLTGQPGGWPLTIFLNPDQHLPFFSGTYFPKEQSFGRPGFKNLLSQVAHFYHQRKDAVEKLSGILTQAFLQMDTLPNFQSIMDTTPLEKARQDLEINFDFAHGGFGHEPKFPFPSHLENLLRYFFDSKKIDVDALHMVNNSLTRMAQGGIFDQIGGGFFRYCVDSNWMIPHFEKMLYDNAQLIMIYSQAALSSNNPFFINIALETYGWLMREMHDPQGGFHSSMNADSEGEEGKYYVWDRQEIRQSLTAAEYYTVENCWNLKNSPNFEGKWHLHISENPDQVAHETLTIAKKKLLSAREKRVQPSRDTKVLTAWNALLIKGLVILGYFHNRNDILITAKNTIDFLKNQMWKNQRLLASYKEGEAYLPAYLDDYVFLLDALLHYLQVSWRDDYFNWAILLADQICEYFFDEKNGGFFYTASDHETLVYRPKSLNDEAIPSGNGIAVLCLIRLGNMLGNMKYLNAAEKTLRATAELINKNPSLYDSILMGLRIYLNPDTYIILRGDEEMLAAWQKIVTSHYAPSRFCYAIPAHAELPEALQKPIPKQGVVAYICQGQSCQQVITNLEEFNTYITGIVSL